MSLDVGAGTPSLHVRTIPGPSEPVGLHKGTLPGLFQACRYVTVGTE